MRQRQEALASLLSSKFGSGKIYPNSIATNDLSRAGLANEVDRTYKRLGGVLEAVPLSFGKWDICLNDFIIELDEEQHFNRYRTITLNSFIYHMEKGFDVSEYGKYCSNFEKECLKKSTWGKYWTSPSTEKQFGNPGNNGDLEILGSPRWRQRAFYDYLRDVFAMVYRIPVMRLSIYDKIVADRHVGLIGNILEEGNATNLNEIVKFIEQKASRLL